MVGHTAGRLITFTIPAGNGAFAPEIMYLRRTIVSGLWQFSPVVDLVTFINSLPTSAVIDVDVLKPNGDPSVANDWFTPNFSYTSTGQQDSQPMFASGIRIRGRSGGTGGDAEVAVFYLY